jgi:sugar lactone lactonase YvrE
VVVASGVGFCEGPVWRAALGDLVVTSISEGALLRVDLTAGTVHRFAETMGGPNGALLLQGDAILVAQNGGMDVTPFWMGNAPPVRPVTPGLQVVEPDGSVRRVEISVAPSSPNDLAVDHDGSVVFTDVLHDAAWTSMTGRLWRLGSGGAVTLIEEVPHYLNGVSAGPHGLLTAEDRGLRWLRAGDRSWLTRDCGRVDGFALDEDGRAYACLPGEGLLVIDTDGAVVERLDLPEGHFASNCCFGGEGMSTLFVTDPGTESVLAFESMPSPGHALTSGSRSLVGS